MSGMPVVRNYSHETLTRYRIINGTEYQFLYARHESWTDPALKILASDQNTGSVWIEVKKCMGEYPGGAKKWARVHNLFWTYEVKP